MNRSTGLLRAYTSLLQRVSGARTVSLFAPAAGEAAAIFLVEGDAPLPEHNDAQASARFHSEHAESFDSVPVRIPSQREPGWLIGVPCAPFGSVSRHPEERRRRKSRELFDPQPGGSSKASEETTYCTIGLRFDEGATGTSKSDEAFRILSGTDRGTNPPGPESFASLLSLGGILAWYAWQISSILDDPVTGLAGRAEFQARLSQAFVSCCASREPLALLLINPDDFTSVNERFGHEAGDQVLREIGARLRAAHRSSDSVAKYGGAIFASFLVDTDTPSARIVAEKVWTTLAESRYLDGTLRLGVSVGLAVFDPHDPTVDGHLELIRRADKALNAAKRFGGGHVATWEPELDAKDLGNLDRMTGVYTGNMAKDYRNMTLLSDTMTVVAGTNGLDELLEQVAERLYVTLRADHVGILEWDDAGEPVVLEGLSRRASAEGGNQAVNGLELDHRRLALLAAVRREETALLDSFSDEYSHQRILAFAAPLLLNDLCLGCLYLDGRADTIALEGSSDLGFLRAFATQLAVALDRARLSEHQKRQQEREHSRLRAEVDDLRRALKHTKLLYRSPKMEAVLETVRRVAPTKATVLVIGESGTGKELVARTLHELSPFRKKPLVVVDCGAIPTTLIESELFGHERGAYTGAQERRIGRLLEAEGGTVILDEIGELPLEVQSKLLRFVQERQLVPVGGTRVRHVDTRLIAVTNRELSVEAAAGRFREDLYYRLNVVRVTVPPLRERPEDVLHLAEHFLDHFCHQYQKGELSFSDEAQSEMLEHSWPGNVRELSNRIMQAVILAQGSEIGVKELELENLPLEATVEMDLSGVRRSAISIAAKRGQEAPRSGDAEDAPSEERAWDDLRRALVQRVTETVASELREPLPMGTWLVEDLVREAYEAAGSVSGRARALLGVPETTFRRKLSKVNSLERAGLLTRSSSWEEVRPRIRALVRANRVVHYDVLDRARSLLLSQVLEQVDDPALGAALMGVTVRTYRRWVSETEPADGASSPSSSDSAPAEESPERDAIPARSS